MKKKCAPHFQKNSSIGNNSNGIKIMNYLQKTMAVSPIWRGRCARYGAREDQSRVSRPSHASAGPAHSQVQPGANIAADSPRLL